MRLHRGVMATVAVLEAGTYAYMAWRYETPVSVVAWALILSRALGSAAPVGLSGDGASVAGDGARHSGAGGAGEWAGADPRCGHHRQ